jgi:hypothetical protein
MYKLAKVKLRAGVSIRPGQIVISGKIRTRTVLGDNENTEPYLLSYRLLFWRIHDISTSKVEAPPIYRGFFGRETENKNEPPSP